MLKFYIVVIKMPRSLTFNNETYFQGNQHKKLNVDNIARPRFVVLVSYRKFQKTVILNTFLPVGYLKKEFDVGSLSNF